MYRYEIFSEVCSYSWNGIHTKYIPLKTVIKQYTYYIQLQTNSIHNPDVHPSLFPPQVYDAMA